MSRRSHREDALILIEFDNYLYRQYDLGGEQSYIKNNRRNAVIAALRRKIKIERDLDRELQEPNFTGTFPGVETDLSGVPDIRNVRDLIEVVRQINEEGLNNDMARHLKAFLSSEGRVIDGRYVVPGASELGEFVRRDIPAHPETPVMGIKPDYDRFGVMCDMLGAEKHKVDSAIKELRVATKELREAQRMASKGADNAHEIEEKIKKVNAARLALDNLNQLFSQFQHTHKEEREYSNNMFVRLLQSMRDLSTITGDSSVNSRIQKMQAELRLAPKEGVDKRFRERIGDLLLILLIDIKMFFSDVAVYIKDHCRTKTQRKHR